MYVYVCMVLPLCLVTITLLYPTQCTTCFVHEAIKLFEFEFESTPQQYNSSTVFFSFFLSFFDGLMDWLIDGLIDWLTDWLTDWLFYLFIDLFIDWLINWSIDWLIPEANEWLCVHYKSSGKLYELRHIANSKRHLGVIWAISNTESNNFRLVPFRRHDDTKGYRKSNFCRI